MSNHSNQPARLSAYASYAYSLIRSGMGVARACELAGVHPGERASLVATVNASAERGAL